MQPNIERGETFMKAVYKSVISALILLGVKSQENLERYTAYFAQELEKNLIKEGFITSELPLKKEEQTAKEPDLNIDISTLKLSSFTFKWLREAGLDTVEKVVSEMQKRPLIELKGIGEKSEGQIREAIKNYMNP